MLQKIIFSGFRVSGFPFVLDWNTAHSVIAKIIVTKRRTVFKTVHAIIVKSKVSAKGVNAVLVNENT